jgi:hypothetical protein
MNISNIRNIGVVNVTPISQLAPPEPPEGSEYDQSTLGYSRDVDLIVAGEMGGDPGTENYISQGFTNENPTMYGYGVIGGYVGTVTKPLYVMLAKGQENPNDPDSDWIAGGTLDPSQIEPGSLYYITLTLTVPAENITGEHHIVLATDEPYTVSPESGWLWTGISTGPYLPGKASTFDGSTWVPISPDTSFYTFTSGAFVSCSNPSGTANQEICGYSQHGQNPDNKYKCINGTWVDQGYDQNCAGSGGGCAQHKTAVECYNAAGCYWYSKYFWEEPSCHDTAQNALMDYLPIIVAGAGGVIIVAALAYTALKKPAEYPPQYPYPLPPKPKKYPQPYYPPYPPYPYPQ